ncbi:hypothetical protein IMZ08_16700 [Bacillus luteolus]|uniref:Lipoprotein n=1 Tax=Litchfieldia luteola TaxID=682179 RepID=A0ABR9QMK8_9BACI|nr:hypothetical protein [Cytobacillus luteolus]MBE4909684.1 hypothetical protein [Cytobacillus luteolus]MBP1944562.1 hypothetical protein [Cytobacillus luteolus]
MKQSKFLVIGLIIASLIACSNKEQSTDANGPTEPNPSESSPSNEIEKEDPSKTEDEENKKDTKDTKDNEEKPEESLVDSIKGENLLGLNQEEIKNLYGEPAVSVNANQYLVWRYDFANENYVYEEGVISVDVSGLQSGQMKAQLTVEFGDDDIVDVFSIYYVKNGQILHYRVTKEGIIEESASAD